MFFMTFNPRKSVDDGLLLLAERLDLIITDTLSNALQGLEWTIILEELDRSSGRRVGLYRSKDLQAQLRMLTERLGNLGYPFEKDSHRVVSTLGQELRHIRNRHAHNDTFTVLDAFRTHDFCVRLLEQFGDRDGADRAKDLRYAALSEYVKVMGVEVPITRTEPSIPQEDIHEPQDAQDADVSPDPRMLVRKETSGTPNIGFERSVYEPWTVVHVGDPAVISNLRKQAPREQVRSLAEEIVEFEGPIHMQRLVSLIAASFDRSRLSSTTRNSLERQVRNAGLTIDSESFVWPATIDLDAWKEFRPNDSSAGRRFEFISPREIANAARYLREDGESLTEEELEKLTLQTFGRERRSRGVQKHLNIALAYSMH